MSAECVIADTLWFLNSVDDEELFLAEGLE